MRRRLRPLILITGTLLCVLIAAAFVVSARWQLALQYPGRSGPMLILMAGSATFVTDDLLTRVFHHTHSYGLSRWNSWVAYRKESKLVSGGWVTMVTFLEFPLYAVFAAVAIPTLLVWRFGRKLVKPGHCRCGYDLTGNTSGVCPECGKNADVVVSTAVRAGSKQP